MLSKEDILLILQIIAKQYGPGYSKDREVARIQAALSMMLELAPSRPSNPTVKERTHGRLD